MITSSPLLAAMGLGVQAIERKQDFHEAVQRLVRARDEEQVLQAARQQGRDDSVQQE